MSKSDVLKWCPHCNREKQRHYNARKCSCGASYECLNCRNWQRTAVLLAKLAADKPMFFNPLEVWEAQTLRDAILKQVGLIEKKAGAGT